MKFDRVAARMLFGLGILTTGTGTYFLFLRPAMLPEDVHFTGMDPQQMSPEMLRWLKIVFQTWGGFITAFGILLGSIASYMFTLRSALLRWGVAIAVLVAFGRFLASNISIRSDFLWFIAGLFAIALVTTLRLAWRARHSS